MLPVKHSINLYLPRFRPPTLSRDIQLLAKAGALTVAGLLTVTLVLWAVNAYTTAEIENLKAEQEAKSNELTALIAQLPNMSIEANLEESINKEKRNLAQQSRVISFLRQDLINDRSSFTPLFEQLSLQQIEGIWLSKIEVLNDGRNIQLYGYAQTPEKVSRYISALGEKNAYIGRTFKQINVIQGDSAWNEFFLSTKKQKINDQQASKQQENSAITNRVVRGFQL